MTSVCFYFQVHQPFRIKPYSFEEIGHNHFYEYESQNRSIMEKVSEKCYLRTNALMLELIKKHEGKFRISYSISGVCLEQFELYKPEVIQSFKDLVATGCVEILAETYYHSLSFFYSKKEFERQVQKHADKVFSLFGVKPKVFRNTELMFSNEVASYVSHLGYKGIICEGVDRLLQGRTPNYVYQTPAHEPIGLLLKNYSLSDDMAFRFSNREWKDFPLTAPKFARWVHATAGNAETINLFMDYETFGEHQWPETGIFDFLEYLPSEILKHPDFDFKTPSEVIDAYPKRDVYDVPYPTSWADSERDLSAWLENRMQQQGLHSVYSLEEAVLATGNQDLLHTWGKLQTSDHFYYMSTKFWSDGDVHKYFSPFDSPYDAAIFYMNVLSDFKATVEK
jgi:alpha-amylase